MALGCKHFVVSHRTTLLIHSSTSYTRLNVHVNDLLRCWLFNETIFLFNCTAKSNVYKMPSNVKEQKKMEFGSSKRAESILNDTSLRLLSLSRSVNRIAKQDNVMSKAASDFKTSQLHACSSRIWYGENIIFDGFRLLGGFHINSNTRTFVLLKRGLQIIP